MREPFQIIEFNPHPTRLWIKGDWVEIPNFRASRLVSCYYDYYTEIKAELEGKKKTRITEELSNIFDYGSLIHEENEDFSYGARGIIDMEKALKVIHESKEFTISAHYDKNCIDLYGRFFEDLKSTKLNGIMYFIMDYLQNGTFGFDYRYQIGMYSYLNYIHKGYYNDKGVITKVIKIDEEINKKIKNGSQHFYSCPKCFHKFMIHPDLQVTSHRNKISFEDTLPNAKEMRMFIRKHPVIKTVLRPDKYPEDWLIEECVKQMKEFVNDYNGKCWKCSNCRLSKDCIVRIKIEG